MTNPCLSTPCSRGGNLFGLRARLMVALAVLASCGAATWACDTPVYQYAMYHPSWRPNPFYVFYLHEGPADPADEEVNRQLTDLENKEPEQVNVALVDFDLSDEGQAAGVPGLVREVWETQLESKLPAHLVIAPHGGVVFAGRLKTEDVAPLADSPARQKLANLLAEGHAGVLLMLTGEDADETAAAEKVMSQVVKLAADGEIVPSQLVPPGLVPSEEADDGKLKVGMMTVSRDDPKEAWFIKMLLAVERDLVGEPSPIVYGAYGRGRVTLPYLSRGINEPNLVDCVTFMSGACSCEIKEQNPGMDLLTTYDWDRVAAQVEAELGEEDPLAALVPQVLVPGLPADPGTPSAAEEAIQEISVPLPSTVAAATAEPARPAESSTVSKSPVSAETGSLAGRLASTLGVGVGIACLALLAASVLLLRKGGTT